jgi:hypothetical protein
MSNIPVLVLCTALASFSGGPEIVSVRKIWDTGRHNAFTDLIRFHDRWFCTFREADGHVGGDGKLRVLESTDGERWESAALLAEDGIDLRDPKLSCAADSRLMIVAGGSVYQGTRQLKGRQPRVAFSADGRQWTPTQRVLEEGEWLWRVTWHRGRAWGVSYNASKTDTWPIRLVSSTDGVRYEQVAVLEVPGRPNESTLRFLDDGTMVALVRREGGSQNGWIGTSSPPYTRWRWHETSCRLGGPNFIVLPNGQLWAGSRHHPGGPKTVLARLTPEVYDQGLVYRPVRRGIFHRLRFEQDLVPLVRYQYEPVLTLPSGGDNSYPGLVWHDGLLWMSYYSSHEGKSSIYLAKIRIE